MKKLSPKCTVCGSHPGSIFCNLAGSHLKRLEQEKIVREFQKGEVIFYEGNQPYELYWICSGSVKLYKLGPKGEPLVLRLLGPGDIFGYRALLAEEPYAATAKALENTDICSISKETLLDLLHHSPELTLQLLKKLAKELRTSEEHMLEIAQETVRERTARLLVFLLQGSKENLKSDVPLKVPLLRKEMAEMIGTTPESLSRTLHYLAERGILKLTRSEIYVRNFSALQLVAHQS